MLFRLVLIRVVRVHALLDAVPNRDIVGEHPDYVANREAYLKIFKETFLEGMPPEAGVPENWESMWMKAFAADPTQPDDYGPNERSPSWTVSVDLDRYSAAENLKAEN